MRALAVLFGLLSPLEGSAQQIFREDLRVGTQYHVSCRTEIRGKLVVEGKELPVEGHAKIDYDERILSNNQGTVDKAIRVFQQMEFQRKVGDQLQQNAIRPEVRRMVLLRHNHQEVPFSPGGPLRWGEIDLVRTDVFTPALAGLIPPRPLRNGDKWLAEDSAVRELTDLERVTKGGLECIFLGIREQLGRPHAMVSFKGVVEGVCEDGPAHHELDGILHFDTGGNYLDYVSINGKQTLVDPKGKPQGEVRGTFVLTRRLGSQNPELTDAALRSLKLDPDEDNTQLLFDDADSGTRFLHSRRWRVTKAESRQIVLDERRGSGLLITFDPPDKTPSGQQFRVEVEAWLKKNNGRTISSTQTRILQTQPSRIEQFSYHVELQGKQMVLDYCIVKTAAGGAILAARLDPANAVPLQGDVERIAKSLQPGK
jgi:hypothetical protein